MELKEFIKETLTQIVEGVKEAQEATKETGAKVSEDSVELNVHFEVSLMEIDEKGDKKGIGVAFQNIGIGKTKESSFKGESLTKVLFKVPLKLPKIPVESLHKICDFDLPSKKK